MDALRVAALTVRFETQGRSAQTSR